LSLYLTATAAPPGRGGFTLLISAVAVARQSIEGYRAIDHAVARIRHPVHSHKLSLSIERRGSSSDMSFERTNSALYLCSQLAKGLGRALHRRASALGFSPGQFPVLLVLWHEDGLTQR
jgi:hypothetical protein